jgi:Ankyrin repeats (3 copies)
MTSKENGEAEDQELLARYRRASSTEASVPNEAVRAAIIAESRRVAEQFAERGSRPAFDTSRPAANDSRWKIPAFGTLGAALLAALLIAPRYWQTPPANNVATAPQTAADSAPAPAQAQAPTPPAAASTAPLPKLESVSPTSRTEPLHEVVVSQANRRRSDAPAETAAKTSAEPAKDLRLASAPAPAAAPALAPQTANARAVDSAIYNSADRLAGVRSAPMPARLQSAAKAGDLEQATLLLDQGSEVNARDAQGRTPLMLATVQGRLEVVRLLLQRGADPNIGDNSGKTPLQQATDQNLNDIAGLLRGAGAH